MVLCVCLQMSMWRCNEELRVCAERQRCAKRDAKHYIGVCYLLTSVRCVRPLLAVCYIIFDVYSGFG